jgi:hypothetical protein
MRIIFRKSIHTDNKSHDCVIAEFGNRRNGGKIVKITYEAHNAVERCNVEIFDGYKWNHFLSMLDMGIEPNTSAYNIWNASQRKKRADDLFQTAESMCKSIF